MLRSDRRTLSPGPPWTWRVLAGILATVFFASTLVEFSHPDEAAAGPNDLLLVTADGLATGRNAELSTLFQGFGWTVTAIDDDASPAALTAAAESSGVVYIASGTNVTVAEEFAAIRAAVVSEETSGWESLLSPSGASASAGIASAGSYTDLEIIDASHPITSPLGTGNTAMLSPTGNWATWTVGFGPGVQSLATPPGNSSQQVLLVAESGASLLEGEAEQRRVLFGLENAAVSTWNATLRATVERALDWAAAGVPRGGPPVSPIGNLVMVTVTGGFGTDYDPVKRNLFESFGWTVSALDDDATPAEITAAADANDVLFMSGTVNATEAYDVRDENIGIVNENFSGWSGFLNAAAQDQDFTIGTTVELVDTTHPITDAFTAGTLSIHSSTSDINYWDSSVTPLPAGVDVLAESPTSTDHDALLAAEAGATLYSAYTAANRRVWFPSDFSDPAVWTADYETLLQRSLLWAASMPTDSFVDSDGDGLWDSEEDGNTDADNDPATTPGPNTDGDAFPNYLDADDDDDGTPTASENPDPNGDGDPRDALDSDRDAQPDYLDAPVGPTTATVTDEQKISSTQGGLIGPLPDGSTFGAAVASIGDLDGDGINDIVVGAGDDGPGAVYVLLLNADGTVKLEQKIANSVGGLVSSLDAADYFGGGVAGLGDVDGDGIGDLAVTARLDDDGGTDRGAVYILFLNADGTVRAQQKISETAGGLSEALQDSDWFGSGVAAIGDLDGDGLNDLFVGMRLDDDGGIDRGAGIVLFLNADGTVKAEQKISSTQGGLAGPVDDGDNLGEGVAGLGDVDGDGIPDVAIGSLWDDDGGADRGAVYVLFLNTDGTVKTEQKISDTAGGFQAPLADGDLWSHGLGAGGDLDGDGTPDLLVGSFGEDDGGTGRGSAYVLFLNADGTVSGEQKISDTVGGLTGPLDDFDLFGSRIATVGDLDGDGQPNLVIGASRDGDGGPSRGAVYIVDLSPAGCSVDSDGDGLWDCEEDANADADDDPVTSPGPNTDGDAFPNYLDTDDDGDGSPTANENADPNADGDPRDARDADRDGEPDYLDIEAGSSSTPVVDEQKISDLAGGLIGPVDSGDWFGTAAASIGDLDGDGVVDVAVGANGDDDGGTNRGAIYVLFLNPDGSVRAEQKISDTAGDLTTSLDNFDQFGNSIAHIGDLDGDGVPDLAVGSRFDDDSGSDRGAVYILFLNPDGTVKAEQKISGSTGGLGATLGDFDEFGMSVGGLGDLDGDGLPDLAVGARSDDDGGSNRGAVYVLFLNADGSVKTEQKISDTTGGMVGSVADNANFGTGIAGLGDLDGDSNVDMAVGAWNETDGGTNGGAVFVLLLNADGTVRAEQKISETQGGLTATLGGGDSFGASVSGLGDIDGDGIGDLAVGAPDDDDGGTDRGAVYLLRLNSNGTVKGEEKISDTAGGFSSTLDDGDEFGYSVASLGDHDDDLGLNLIVGAWSDDDGGADRGAVYILDLEAVALVVNSTGDAGDATPGDDVCDTGGFNGDGAPECTLRAAIQEANASAAPSTIDFALTATDPNHSAGTWTISPSTGLPSITTPMTIDGTTQPGFVPNTNPAPQAINWTQVIMIDGTSSINGSAGLRVFADEVAISGLTIGNFYWSGGYGLEINADRTTVTAMSIGTDLTGLVAANLAYGIWATGTDSVIGGPTPGDRNLITGADNGQINFSPGINTMIDGNLIATNVDASALLALWGTGVEVWSGSNVTVGTPAAGNVIGGDRGMEFGSVGGTIENNVFGTNDLFSVDLGGWQAFNTFGAGTSITGNVVGNWDEGIAVTGDSSILTGNWIGTDPSGTVDLGNLDFGIEFANTGTNGTVGGTSAADANVIANNGGAGISVRDAGAIPAMLGNEIFGNGALGIDILRDGVTVNSAADAILDFPTITDASAFAGAVSVDVELDVPAGDYRVELFENPTGGDPSGYGEGQTFVHGVTITHAGLGLESFAITYPGTTVNALVATATVDFGAGAFGPSSEYSGFLRQLHQVNSTGDAGDLTPGDGLCDTGGSNAIALDECTLRAAIEEANAFGPTTILFDMPFADPGQSSNLWTLSPASEYPEIVVPMTIDGSTQASWSATPVVEIDGSATTAADGLRLNVGAEDSIIRSLAIGGFGDVGLEIRADRVGVFASHLGTDATGLLARPIVNDLVYVRNADDVRIGGAGGDGNLMNAATDGVVVSASSGVLIEGNTFGSDVAGAALDVFASDGIRIESSSPGASIRNNVIGNVGDDAIDIRSGSGGFVIQGNSLGTDGAGTAILPIEDSVIQISNGVVGGLIGGPGLGEGNRIEHAQQEAAAISILGPSTSGIAILGNTADHLFGFIDLDEDGPSTNDALDADVGANDLLNFPEPLITSSTTSDSITWSVDLDVALDVPAGDYRIEVYSSPSIAYSGDGRAEELVHAFNVTHLGSGTQTFSTSYAGPEPLYVSTTATEDLGSGVYGSTSELSMATLTVAPVLTVNSTDDATDNDLLDGVCETGAINSEGDPECTLRAAIEQANAAESITIEFAVPTSDPGHLAGPAYWVIDPIGSLPALFGRGLTIDGSSQPTFATGRPVIHVRAALDDAFDLAAADITLQDFSIGSPGDDAIQVRGDRAVIDRMWVGIDPTETLDGSSGSGNEGVIIYNGSDDLVIRDSRIAGFDSGIVSNSGTMDATITGTEIFENRNGGVAFNNVGRITLLGNAIHDNIGLGLDLAINDGIPLPNDVGDGDAGPNDLLNKPIFTSATLGAGTVDLDYTIDVPAGTYRIEFFDSDRPDPTGFGEGQTFLSAETIVHPGGSAAYTATVVAAEGDVITATASPDLGGGTYGGTSEFSNARSLGVVFVNSTSDTGDLATGDGVCDTGAANADGNIECTLRAAIEEANASVDLDIIHFQLPLLDANIVAGGSVDHWLISPGGSLPGLTDVAVLDATTQPSWAGTPLIRLDGGSAGAGVDGFGGIDQVEVSGLSITRWPGNGVSVGGTAVTLRSNWFGVTPVGVVEGNADSDVIAFGSASDLTVGGPDDAAGNVFAAAGSQDGVLIANSTTNVLIEQNHFGVAADGVTPLGGVAAELLVVVDDTSNVTIRTNQFGDAPAAAVYTGNNTTGVVIVGNVFGTDSTGTVDLTNVQALYTDTSGTVQFGGPGSSDGNLLRNSTFDAIASAPTQTGDVTLLGNSIAASGLLAFDNANDGADVLDAGDGDGGPNGRLNYPEIVAVGVETTGVVVAFDLDVPAGTYRIEAFSNPSGADPTGYGEGEIFAGAVSVTHAGSGPQRFEMSITADAGDAISLTTTEDLGGGSFGATSEFAFVGTAAAAPIVEDLSVRSSDLLAAGGATPAPVPGIAAAGSGLDGGLERLVGPATDLTSDAVTMSAWVNRDTSGLDPRVISKGVGAGTIYELLIDSSSNEAVARLDIGGVLREVRGGLVPTSSWHHVTATWDGSTIRLFVDGVQVDSLLASGALSTDLDAPLVIGNTVLGTSGLDGSIDQVELQHREWSAVETQARFVTGSSPGAYLSLGSEQFGSPDAWTTSTDQSRGGASALAAPETVGGDAWVTALGIDEPGVEVTAWWWVSDPASSEQAVGTRTGVAATDQFEAAARGAGLDLALMSGSTRTPASTSATVLAPGSWQQVRISTDELGVTSLTLDGTPELGPSLLSGLATGSVGFRAADIDPTEQWFIDDVRVRRLVSDEPTTSLGPLERN